MGIRINRLKDWTLNVDGSATEVNPNSHTKGFVDHGHRRGNPGPNSLFTDRRPKRDRRVAAARKRGFRRRAGELSETGGERGRDFAGTIATDATRHADPDLRTRRK